MQLASEPHRTVEEYPLGSESDQSVTVDGQPVASTEHQLTVTPEQGAEVSRALEELARPYGPPVPTPEPLSVLTAAAARDALLSAAERTSIGIGLTAAGLGLLEWGYRVINCPLRLACSMQHTY